MHLIWNCHYSNGKLPLVQNRKGSFWWCDSLKLLDLFKGLVVALVHSGDSCFFWLDMWNNLLLSHLFLQLFSYVKDQTITVQQFCQTENMLSLFHLPLSEEAFQQYHDLGLIINGLQLQQKPDQWTYIWGSALFSSSKVYKHLYGSIQAHPAFRWLWKSCCQNKHKVFFWLLMRDRLSTRELLRRRNMHLDDYNYVLCTSLPEELVNHLFLACPSATACWDSLGLIIQQPDDPSATLQLFRIQLQLSFFMEIIITMCWSVWAVKNDLIFRDVQPSMQRCQSVFKREFAQVILRVKAAYLRRISQWLEAFV